jgi:hypothetical protein
MNDTVLKLLESGTAYSFGEWPNPMIPQVAIGVYTIWENDRLLYGGLAGVTLTKRRISELRRRGNQRRGLSERLLSHASGRRRGDQFCLEVCDRLVLPKLTAEAITQIAQGALSLDDLTRCYIRERLTYRFVEVNDARTARSLEKAVRSGGLVAGKPVLNPT